MKELQAKTITITVWAAVFFLTCSCGGAQSDQSTTSAETSSAPSGNVYSAAKQKLISVWGNEWAVPPTAKFVTGDLEKGVHIEEKSEQGDERKTDIHRPEQADQAHVKTVSVAHAMGVGLEFLQK